MINLALLTTEQKAILFFILIEVLIVAVFVIASLIAQILLQYNFRKQKKIGTLDEYFLNPERKLPTKNFELIFLRLRESQLPPQKKDDFVAKNLLKHLRKFINSRSWIKRYFLVEGYGYAMENEDKENVIRLINDKNIIISLNAMLLNNELKDPDIYKIILGQLSKIDQTTRSLYFNLMKPNKILKQVLNKIIEHSDNSLMKKVCYDIIYHLKMGNDFYDLALRDIEQTDRNCQLAAIRVLGYADPEKAKHKLFDLLKSNNWLIRNSAIQSIKDLNVSGTLDELYKCLNDENYWVRVNATKKLMAFGKEGQDLLNQYKNASDSQYKEVATYFFGIDNLKEKE
ncbi:MAG TPA: HEAT repeat domain-containing protein [Legionella sp.]|nr:HEAT repeat domain-containing protein [Legionella sp.]